jgi:hypothetical protein
LAHGPAKRNWPHIEPTAALPAGLPPAPVWVGQEANCASNGNAIRWNVALLFVLAGMLN